jgi:hypothetical protein
MEFASSIKSDRVIEGICYALSSSANDHRRSSDHRILGPAVAAFP